MKTLLLAALAVPLGLGTIQEPGDSPDRVVISSPSYARMHGRVAVYGAAAHLADVLFAIHDGQRHIEVDVPVIAPLAAR